MARTIIDRTISSETSRGFQLTESTYVRKMEFGSNWNHLRVVIRCGIPIDTATTDVPAPRFFMGVTSGLLDPPGTISPNHFVGIRTRADQNFHNNNADYVFSDNIGTSSGASVIANGTETSYSSTGSGNNYTFFANASTCSSIFLLEITKGSPNYTINYKQIINPNLYISNAGFESYMASGTGPTGLSQRALVALPVDEATNGPLDSICLSWGNSSIPIEVTAFKFARIS